MSYVDGFLLPLPTTKIEEYRQMAETAGKIWMEHGALAFRECIAEDLAAQEMLSFPDVIQAKDGETVVFSFIVFKSREHRDEVNAKVMADPRLKDHCNPDTMPFECKRMAYGGFETLVEY
ncbi:MAG: DUF1428 domain-containing protein [Gammaproteobacteria bacterium]